jgi:uncharacterized membrane protein
MAQERALARLVVSGAFLTRRERFALLCACACSLGGMVVAAYLVHLHTVIAGNPRRGVCTFTDTVSCDVVLASKYADIGGVPVALIGFVGFALLFGLAAWRLLEGAGGPRWLPPLLVAIAGFGLAFELVMTWVEFFVIQAVCPYCVTALAQIGATFIAALVAWRAAKTAPVPGGTHA